jgi:hypothetical protein
VRMGASWSLDVTGLGGLGRVGALLFFHFASYDPRSVLLVSAFFTSS